MPGKGCKGPEPSQLPSAPTYYPTVKEFADPLAYIASIRPEAEAFGACKIVPPAGWVPPFSLDRTAFSFKTRVQSVHELQERSTAEEAFEEEYHSFLKVEGKVWRGPPLVSGREVDLYKLFRIVQRRGGYDAVSESKTWREICRILQVRDKSGNAAYTVRQLYQKHLLPYEEHCAKHPQKTAPAPRSNAKEPAPKEVSEFDRMVAAASGKEDMDLLGAVAALMDVPSSDALPNKRLKLDPEAGSSKEAIRVPSNIYTMVCELCKGGHREDKIILCDKCDRGCHMFCLQPPLTDVPEGEWICPLCVAEEVDSRAFREGKQYSLDQFERLAKEFKVNWFGSQAAADKATEVDIERAFWDVVEEGEEPVEVMYGADLDTSRLGSGFPTVSADSSLPDGQQTADGEQLAEDAQPHAQYSESPWNLNNLPRLEGSLLRHLEDNIAGVTLPWMYMGMMFSSFCWHIEDHMFYSINYHHWGEAKRWYSVPSSSAEAFEAAFRTALPELFEKQPDVLFHLVTMLSPRILQAAEVPVYAISQGPGEFVVTFPCAYHGGFNMGLNCAEAVNFAPPDWLRFGGPSVERFRSFRKQPVLSHAWLLLQVAGSKPRNETAYWAEKDLRRVVAEETEWRLRLQQTGCYQARCVELPVGMLPGARDDAECAICHCYLHLSAVECRCCPKRYVCLRHANNLCECPASSWRLAYRHSLGELSTILADLAACVPPELKSEPQENVPNVNGNLAEADMKMEDAEPSPTPEAPQQASQSAQAPSAEPSMDESGDHPMDGWVDCNALPEPASRDPPGNLARTDSAELEATPYQEHRDSPVAAAAAAVAPPQTIPRKRGRKANKDRRSVKRRRSDEPEEPAQMRVTRAAIRAEEEAQDTMDVLSALAGLADMVEFDAHGRGDSRPAEERRPTPQPPENGAEGRSYGASSRPASRAASVGLPGLLGSMQHGRLDALTHAFDVSKAMDDLQALRRTWLERAASVFEQGGFRAGDVEALAQQSQQFMWAGADLQAGIPELVSRLREAQAWAHRVQGFLKNKPSLEDVEAALQWSPAPIAVPGLPRLVEGARAARSWLERKAEVDPEWGTAELRTLETLVSEGQRLPIAVPQLKALKERMTTSRQLLEAVRSALPSRQASQPTPVLPAPEKMRSRRKKLPTQEAQERPAQPPPSQVQEVTLEWLRVLRAQAGSLKVRFSELDQLCQAISAVEAFQARTKEVLQVKPALPVLRDLAAECDSLAVSIPEMQTVKSLIAEAKAWLNKAKGVTQSRTLLKRMREVLHAGLRLGTELPQVEQLRQEIRKREWEAHAQKALTNKQTITALTETLEDAVTMGADQTELAEGIRKRLEEGRAWGETAARFLAAPGRPPISALEELVDAGNELGIKLERLTLANQALNAAISWANRAEEAASADHTTPPDERPSLIEVQALLVDYQGLVVALPEAESLIRKRDEAQAWARQAQKVLSQPLSESLTHEYEKMVVEGWATGVQMDELAALQDCLAALEWMKRMRRFDLSRLRPALQQPGGEPEQPASTPADAPQGPAAAAQLPEQQASPSRAVAVADAAEPQDPAAEAAVQQPAASAAPPQAPASLPNAEPRGAAEPAQPSVVPTSAGDAPTPMEATGEQGATPMETDAAPEEAREGSGAQAGPSHARGLDGGAQPSGREVLTVEEAQHLVEEGEHLPVDQEVLAALRHNLQLVQSWEARLSNIGHSQAAGEQAGIPPDQLLPLVEEARGMALQPESLPALEDALAKAAAWQARAARLFKDGEQPHFAEVSAIAASGRELLVQAPASRQVEAVVAAGETWREGCRRLLAKRNSGQRLGKCVKIMATGLERAVEQLQLRLQEEANRPVADEPGSSGAPQEQHEYEEDERDLYCVCQQPYNVDTAMISCDSCEEWYHCRCIGLTQTTARSIKMYICPVCLAVRGSEKELEQALGRTRRTRRALPESLRAAVAEAASLPCIMEEAEALTHTLALLQQWVETAEAALRSHEAAQLASDAQPRRQPAGGDVPAAQQPPPQPAADQAQSAAEPARPCADAVASARTVDAPTQAQPAQSAPEPAQPGDAAGQAGVHAAAAEAAQGQAAEGDDGGIELGTSEALDALLSHDVGPDLDAMEAAMKRAPPQPAAAPPPMAAALAGVRGSLSIKTLSQLVKSALSMEVEVGDLQERLLTALKQQRWRIRVEAALKPNSKYTADGLSKLVKEGEAMGLCLEQDSMSRPLLTRTKLCRDWLDQVQAVVQRLSEAGEDKDVMAQSIQEAQGLMEQGRNGLGLEPSQLPRGFDKELGRLEEACKLYCLCQQPYNEDRPMLSCDYCQDWFHYDCIGLRAPSDDEDDEDVAPQDYRCPACCWKAGVKYPHQEKLPIRSLEALGDLVRPPADNRDLGTITGASRLHELLTPSQAQALGEAQQAMLIGGIRPPPQQHSWLLNVLAQQQRFRPALSMPATAMAQSFVGGPTTGFSVPANSFPAPIMLANFHSTGQMPGSFVLPHMPQAPPPSQPAVGGIIAGQAKQALK